MLYSILFSDAPGFGDVDSTVFYKIIEQDVLVEKVTNNPKSGVEQEANKKVPIMPGLTTQQLSHHTALTSQMKDAASSDDPVTDHNETFPTLLGQF